jgi:hypothetical protein
VIRRAAARQWRRFATAVFVTAAAILPSPAAAQPLAVPFLPQTEDLCGGAAAAMVMRYWGASDAFPDAFQPLVDRGAGGIRTTTLTTDLERRGWTAVAGSGDAAEMTKELGRGRPVIALIEDRPGRYHYVVVLARVNDRVVVHDPARGPNRSIDASRFDAAWARSERWMLLLLPPPAVARSVETEESSDRPGSPSACARAVSDAVQRAADDHVAARTLLTRATAACPAESAAWRELAGLDALDSDWAAAASRAARAVAIDPGDALAWRILATARYLNHDEGGALDAWNQVGEPAVNLVDVTGLTRTRYDVVDTAIGVPLRSVLTADALRLADRRVRDVPSVAAARVAFHPVDSGHAQIDAAVFERDRAPWGAAAWAGMGFDALTSRQISATFSSPTGGGETFGATWRWWEHRPMIAGFYAAPAPRALGGGVWRLDASRETQTFGRAAIEETRTRVAMTIGQWLTDRTRMHGSAIAEQWSDRRADVAFGYGVDHWRAADRLRFSADVMQALGADPFTTAAAHAAVRSKVALDGVVAMGLAGYSVSSAASPLSVWPGADTGQARDVLLRAHPLLDDGIVTSGVFGRRLAFATAEAQRWSVVHALPIRIAPAAFVDVARATDGLDAMPRLEVDAGVGIRVAIPGAAGVMRVDVARGLRDGGTVLSAGWDVRWR